jgi:sulfatase modifying factor 1
MRRMVVALALAPWLFGCQVETATALSSSAGTSSAPTATSATPSALPSAAPAAAPPEVVPAGMARISEGIFLMGANHAVGNPEEKPSHEAIVPAFYMDVAEVTLAQYSTCVSAGACDASHRDHRFCNSKFEGRQDHPVNCIDLFMAEKYCKSVGKRVPTEREWEYAASGGSERRRFSWGAANPTQENNCYEHPGGSCPVKSFEPGAFGLYDMTGNVWEWTASRFDPYPSDARPHTIEKKGRLMFVYRGGSWSRRFPKWMRNVLRNRYEPDKYSASIGMRCMKTVDPLVCPKQTEAKDGVCVRNDGDTLCEPKYTFDGKQCIPDVAGETAKQHGTWPPKQNSASAPADSSTQPVTDVITRSRTPQHDADCKRHWPKTPASYMFRGGKNYPSRKPTVSGAGCVPRDMGWSWTSACCAG